METNKETVLGGLLQRARTLEERSGRLAFLGEPLRLSLRLRQFLEGEALSRAEERPVVIALIGGTGTGKSTLFNALVGKEGASPASVVRACTKVPHVAASERDLSLLGNLGRLNPAHVPCDSMGLVLIDTPDLDSVEKENRYAALQVMETADVLVYVTIPERVSDFVLNRTIREEGDGKRWFFILNKIDSNQDAKEEVRREFDLRLQKLGFHPDERTRFLVSSLHPGDHEFPGLVRAVYSARAAEAVRSLRRDAILGLLQHALRPDAVIDPLRERASALRKKEEALDQRVREVYRQALETENATRAVRLLVRNRTWLGLSSRSGWIMGWVVWVKCRGAMLSSAWQLGRMAARGPTVTGILWVAAASLAGAIRGVLPLRNLRQALESEAQKEMEAVEADARRIMEDEGLPANVLPNQSSTPATHDEVRDAWLRAVRTLPVVGGETARAMELTSQKRSLADDLLGPLDQAMDEAAEQAAMRAGRKPVAFLANILPTAVLAHAAWRMGRAWYFAQWLPGSFYGLGAAVFLLSLIPGYLLLASSIRAGAKTPVTGTVLRGISRPGVTAPIRAAREELEGMAAEAAALENLARKTRALLETELPTGAFGAKAGVPREQPSSPT